MSKLQSGGEKGKGRGAFIVFEGLDRSGKTTQSSALVDALREKGVTVQTLRFPVRSTKIGEILNEYLSKGKDLPEQVAHLLFSANRWEMQPKIEEWLRNGDTVITDRYAFSGIAYSSGALGLDPVFCRTSDSGVIAPDAVFFLKVDPEVAAKRGDYGQERYERLETQKRVAAAYGTFDGEPFWKVLDGHQPQEALKAQVLSEAQAVLSACAQWDGSRSEFKRLWGPAPISSPPLFGGEKGKDGVGSGERDVEVPN
uniref:Thymidylate kinase n=1 Tax=Chromera velia CCMP2878 TaxID=1169474 RepID=A0A0G4GM40_9ALVE|mmetsp:Transcript_53077/g.103852  ORF Transcript_53077/g.103852 Transcript_53077/m.103852 type:complete len:255 (+) Transcript_53077:404-1168(+)|eukprot:Cvel_4903.t1-p1 / transcript=Cvel_4903.t1 / gene=Cvel_4903 / organism=Chromera_velia_CCMP2878 / gene_product=Thymidylate kinase, putative / transcript_product=Thymidylate kinase, putative / location=Cvel_scaffold221:31546-34177(-) / protein_length=254 / sequence_SO=supercontig / SO=protein_coding / is_pseudo=false